MAHTSEVGFSKFEADKLIRNIPLKEKFQVGKIEEYRQLRVSDHNSPFF